MSRRGQLIESPPPPFNALDHKVYEIALCANDTERGPCNRQAQRGLNADWECAEHGRCDKVAFAEVTGPVRVVLG